MELFQCWSHLYLSRFPKMNFFLSFFLLWHKKTPRSQMLWNSVCLFTVFLCTFCFYRLPAAFSCPAHHTQLFCGTHALNVSVLLFELILMVQLLKRQLTWTFNCIYLFFSAPSCFCFCVSIYTNQFFQQGAQEHGDSRGVINMNQWVDGSTCRADCHSPFKPTVACMIISIMKRLYWPIR